MKANADTVGHPSLRLLGLLSLLMTVFLVRGASVSWAQGEIVAWGRNDSGQCNVPEPNTDFAAVAAGSDHSLGLKADGSIVAWGYNYHGQCNVPPPNTNFTAIAAGENYSLGLKADGSIVAWGLNNWGQCSVPSPNTGFTAVASGDHNGMGLKVDGTIVTWGYNEDGRCNVPLPNTGFTAVAAGYDNGLGLKADGSIVAWGYGGYGECNVPSPNMGFTALAVGERHVMGLKAGGSIVTWGWNDSGQRNVPEPNTDFAAIAAGWDHSLGLRSDGSIVAWGYDGNGECNVPVPNEGFTAVAAGRGHSLSLKGIPFVIAVADVPEDQGGQLEVSWHGYYLDAESTSAAVAEYNVQRLGSDWQTLTTVVAAQADSYSVFVPTTDILVVGQAAPTSQYRVVARMVAPGMEFESPPASGCSIDNLPPPKPMAFLVEGATYRYVTWTDPELPDLDFTCVYRGEESGFTPGAPLACPVNFYTETHLGWYFYRVQFSDIHGNLSEFSDELHGQWPTPAPNPIAHALKLYPCQPNPFNPRTTIRYDLPESGPVRLCVFDVAGRLVQTLVDESMPPGSHESVWDGRDSSGREVGSGSYLARLEFSGDAVTMRLGLVR